MEPSQRRWHSGVLAGLACGGLAIGHVLAYVISVPSAADRHEVLLSTGHSYTQSGLTVAVTVAIISSAALIGFGFARSLGVGTSRPNVRWAVTRATLVQVLAFVGLETMERILSGAGLETMFGVHLIVGVVVQLAIGAVAGFLFVALYRTGEVFGSKISPPKLEAATSANIKRSSPETIRRTSRFATPRSTRAPPLLGVL